MCVHLSNQWINISNGVVIEIRNWKERARTAYRATTRETPPMSNWKCTALDLRVIVSMAVHMWIYMWILVYRWIYGYADCVWSASFIIWVLWISRRQCGQSGQLWCVFGWEMVVNGYRVCVWRWRFVWLKWLNRVVGFWLVALLSRNAKLKRWVLYWQAKWFTYGASAFANESVGQRSRLNIYAPCYKYYIR